ncbi:hypothetical protein HDV01_001473 [Terramyces sp. JEL0728]|nr:hypothetical protein HDV01_001473 [Terramyces sp. JEL0728]
MLVLFGITVYTLRKQVGASDQHNPSVVLMLNMVQALTVANLVQLFSYVLENYSALYIKEPLSIGWTIVNYYYCIAAGSKGFLHAIALLVSEYSFVGGKLQSNITPKLKEMDPTLLTIDWKNSSVSLAGDTV